MIDSKTTFNSAYDTTPIIKFYRFFHGKNCCRKHCPKMLKKFEKLCNLKLNFHQLKIKEINF